MEGNLSNKNGIKMARKILFATILSICASSSKKISIYLDVVGKVLFMLILFALFRWAGLVFMDELSRAVAPFVPTLGGTNGGFGPPPAPPYNDTFFFAAGNNTQDPSAPPGAPELQEPDPLQEPDMDSVKERIRERLRIHRMGGPRFQIDDSEIERIINLKQQILDRMQELDPNNPFWTHYRNRLIRDYIIPSSGGEYKVSTLADKLNALWRDNPTESTIYQDLIRRRDLFHIEALSRGRTGAL
ncbi:hypothetical protein LIER_44050 [Lithospermum erythrorhizon]|uniref:HMG box domain-containing protein n=1 Tax=Lithospermum erythrorhizon TaxID=34254 RepID=A0AAV3NMH2_LITER